MPYIDAESRFHMDAHDTMISPGELNYNITRLLNDYVKDKGMGLDYQSINDCLGALEGAKMEFYRRIVVPYEEKKMEENGDVY